MLLLLNAALPYVWGLYICMRTSWAHGNTVVDNAPQWQEHLERETATTPTYHPYMSFRYLSKPKICIVICGKTLSTGNTALCCHTNFWKMQHLKRVKVFCKCQRNGDDVTVRFHFRLATRSTTCMRNFYCKESLIWGSLPIRRTCNRCSFLLLREYHKRQTIKATFTFEEKKTILHTIAFTDFTQTYDNFFENRWFEWTNG